MSKNMIKNKYKIERVETYIDGKIDKDYVLLKQYTEDGQTLIRVLYVEKTDIKDVINLLDEVINPKSKDI